MRRQNGWILILLLLAVLLGAAPCLGHSPRSLVSRARSDMRSLATAIESYYVDHSVYPPAMEGEQLPPLLTTPVAYLTSLPHDPHRATREIRADSYAEYLLKIPVPGRSRVPYWILILLFGLLAAIFSWRAWTSRAGTDRARLAAFASIAALGFVTFGPYISGSVSNWLRFDWFGMRYSKRIRENPPEGSYTGFLYHVQPDEPRWIIQGIGPDHERSMGKPSEDVWGETFYKSPLHPIVEYAYDPTNGIASAGDIFRFQH